MNTCPNKNRNVKLRGQVLDTPVNKIWIHAIWATKERLPLIDINAESKIYEYLRNQLIEMGCSVRIINGTADHVHCLFLLNSQKSIAEVIKQIKGSSSHFINQQNIVHHKFAWQTGYAAFSVSESGLEKVFDYIKNQKQHHQKRTFQQEYDVLLKLNGFDNGENG